VQRLMNAPLPPPLHAELNPLHRELAARLQGATQGEVLFERGARGRYATDASIDQVDPVGVLVPQSADDVAVALGLCREMGVPVLGRGAGTSQCGPAGGAALVPASN